MRRAVHFAVLSVLLLVMQQQVLVHPIAHLAGLAPLSQETAFQAPAPGHDCLECALIAGGFNAVAAGTLPDATHAPVDRFVFASYRSRAAEVPAWFESRAPPVLR